MKFCVSHYRHKSMPDAKFDIDSFSSFGDMTSQTFLLKKGMSHPIRILPLSRENEVNLKKISFMSRIVLFDPSQFHQFSSRGIFFIF